MDPAIPLTAFGTVIAVVASNIALISWIRSDMKCFETEIRGWHQDLRKDMSAYRDEVRNEMKDFHGRLCAIEERNKNIKS